MRISNMLTEAGSEANKLIKNQLNSNKVDKMGS